MMKRDLIDDTGGMLTAALGGGGGGRGGMDAEGPGGVAAAAARAEARAAKEELAEVSRTACARNWGPGAPAAAAQLVGSVEAALEEADARYRAAAVASDGGGTSGADEEESRITAAELASAPIFIREALLQHAWRSGTAGHIPTSMAEDCWLTEALTLS